MDKIKFLQNLGSVASKLDMAERLSLAGSVVGSIAAVASQQVVYAATPLTLALSLSLVNRQRFQQQTKAIEQVVQSIQHQVQVMPDAKWFNEVEASTVRLDETTRQLNTVLTAVEDRLVPLEALDLNPLQSAIAQIQTDLYQLSNQLPQSLEPIQTQVDQLQARLHHITEFTANQKHETLEKAIDQLQLRFQIVSRLCSEIRALRLQQQQLSQISKSHSRQLEQELEKYQEQISYWQTEAKKKSQQCKILEQINQEFMRKMGKHPLDRFEQSILNCLQASLPEQTIHTQFDVATGRDKSKFTDFLIEMKNCIIVIEAKSYKGKIEALGDPRNTEWICQKNKEEIIINACWGSNPYQQVNAYVDGIRSRGDLSFKNKHQRLPVYGVVVFPQGAEVASSIESNVGEFYRVTTLDNLLAVINSIEIKAQWQNKSRMSYNNLSEVLTGTYSRNAA